MPDLHTIDATDYAGADLAIAKRAAIFIHGRGDTSDGMRQLAHRVVDDPTVALLFPKASNATWYPHSFLAPTAANQPWLDSAMELLGAIVADLHEHGIANEDIYFLGFSQGACLALEYTTRHATKYGGVMALSGGLIGPEIATDRYRGDFAGTDILLGCSDVDFHIPLQRVDESAEVLAARGATVDKRIYPGMGHTVNEDELHRAREILQSKSNPA